MSKQFRIQRTIAQIPVSAGGFATLDLPRGYDYESLYIRLTGSVVVSTGATSVRDEAPCQAIQRCEVVADGRNTLHSAPYWFSTLAHVDRDMRTTSRIVTPPTAASAATYAIEALGVIDFMTPDGERPKDSNFRTDALQLFQLRLTFGNALDMFVPGAGVAAFSNCTVEISTSEIVELVDSASGTRTVPVALKKVSFQEIGVAASNANQEVRLPAGNMIKSVMIRTEGLTTAGEPTTGMINNVQAYSGVDVRLNMKGASLRGKNNDDFGIVRPGYYALDFSRNGSGSARLSELWDVTNQAEPKIGMDVTGGANGKLQAVVTEYLSLV